MDVQNQDRRAPGIRRVGLTTLVEICGRAPGVPAFEAESIEVSGRGMHVRTDYLPDINAPLVLRFDHDGKEVVVEGEVAWRRERDNGGDFGIKFTALDTNSVGVLKQLCAPNSAKPQGVAPPEDDGERFEVEPGAAVKLHIGGLGAPMKARVFRGSTRRVHVGSQLEFLKVGRALELEQVDGGERRGAEIDSVSVTVDPQSQVPQLVVSLRYEGQEATPEPSVVDRGESEVTYSRSLDASHRPPLVDEQDDEVDDYSAEPPDVFEDDEELEQAEEEFKQRVEGFVAAASSAISRTSGKARLLSEGVANGINSLIAQGAKRGGSKGSKPKRRTSSPTSRTAAAVGTRGAGRDSNRKLRPQHGSRAPEVTAGRNPKVWLAAAAALVVFGSGAYVLSASDKQSAKSSAPVSVEDLPPAEAIVAATAPPAAADAPPAMPPGLEQPAALAPGEFPQPAALDTEEQQEVETGGIVAQVPMFGKTAMATAEPAPLTPPPSSGIDEYSLAKDQSFRDKPAPASTAEGKTQWQVGRMHLPVIHRLRLDAPGEALQGEKTPNGFSVLIPGRQIKEHGSHIANRDDRISDVRVKNTPAGGKVVFRFRKDIPGYKVRLRNDFIEFFINSPAKK